MEELVEIPKALCWDLAGQEAPRDLLWRLQRIGLVFPVYGRDPKTVFALEKNLNKLKIPPENALLVRIYAEEYRRRA